jgi:uncharacterized protein (TIGR02996 family)
MGPPPPRPWVPPPVVLLPHDDEAQVNDNPYGPPGQGQPFQFDRQGYVARYMFDDPASPWLPEGAEHHPHMHLAHVAAQQMYGAPTLDNVKAFATAGERALGHLARYPQWDAAYKHQQFAARLFSHMQAHGVGYYPSDQVAMIRGLRGSGQDAAPYLTYSDWVQEHGDPLAEKVANHLRVHAHLAAAIRAGGKLPPKLVAQYLEHRAGQDSPLTGPLSFSEGEAAQAQKRFALGMFSDPVDKANQWRQEHGQGKRYNLQAVRRRRANKAQQHLPEAQRLPPDQLQRLAQAIRFRRQGRVTRYMLSDIPHVYRAASDEPHDDKHWGALADLLDDHGTPETAAAIRSLMGGEDYRPPHISDLKGPTTRRADPVGHHRLSGVVGEDPILGHVHGLRLVINPTSAPRSRLLGGGYHDTYVMHVLHPPGSKVLQPVAGITTLNRRQAVGVMHEMQGLTPDDERRLAVWRGHLGRYPGPTKPGGTFTKGAGPVEEGMGAVFMRRGEAVERQRRWDQAAAGREQRRLDAEQRWRQNRQWDQGRPEEFARPDFPGIIRSHFGVIGSNPGDHSRWHQLADTLDFAGRPWSAQAARIGAEQGWQPGEGARLPDTETFSAHHKVWGNTHGMYMQVAAGQDPKAPWQVVLAHPEEKGQVQALVPPEVGAGVLHEIDSTPQFRAERDDAMRAAHPRPVTWAPEFFSAWKAPRGGMVVRGLYEPGGRFVAAEAGGDRPPLGRVASLLARLKARRRMRRRPGVPAPYQ